jgi:hypothetical protein
VDDRSDALVDAAQRILSVLPTLVKQRSEAQRISLEVRNHLVVAGGGESAEIAGEDIRTILRSNSKTREWLEQEVPESKNPRHFKGGGKPLLK